MSLILWTSYLFDISYQRMFFNHFFTNKIIAYKLYTQIRTWNVNIFRGVYYEIKIFKYFRSSKIKYYFFISCSGSIKKKKQNSIVFSVSGNITIGMSSCDTLCTSYTVCITPTGRRYTDTTTTVMLFGHVSSSFARCEYVRRRHFRRHCRRDYYCWTHACARD